LFSQLILANKLVERGRDIVSETSQRLLSKLRRVQSSSFLYRAVAVPRIDSLCQFLLLNGMFRREFFVQLLVDQMGFLFEAFVGLDKAGLQVPFPDTQDAIWNSRHFLDSIYMFECEPYFVFH